MNANFSAQGFVLIFTLLITFILSLLALTLVQVSLMETKMGVYYWEKTLSLIDAENKLLKAETTLIAGQVPREATLITDEICGVKFYRVTTSGKFGTTESVLQSTFAKIGDISRCPVKPKIKEGQQGWVEKVMNNE